MRRLLTAGGLTIGVVVIALSVRGSHARGMKVSAPQRFAESAAPTPTSHLRADNVDWRGLRGAVLQALATPAPAASAPPKAPEQEDPRMVEFQAQITQLNEDCAATGECDARQLLVDQMGLAIDMKLGPNHPAKQRVLDVVGTSFDERGALGAKFQNGDISRRTLFGALTDSFKVMSEKMADILDDRDYERMFGTKKGENPAAQLGLTPQLADDLDRGQATASSGPGAPRETESYVDPG